jgi:hypothetical protein
MPLVWLILIVGGLAALAWGLKAQAAREKTAAAPGAGTTAKATTSPGPAVRDHGAGADPLPRPAVIEGPNVRIIDLRRLPDDEVRIGRFGATAAIIRAHGPISTQVFVVSLATAQAWVALTDVALMLVLARLKDMRKGPGTDFLYLTDGSLDAAGAARCAAAGIEIAVDLTVVGSERSVNIVEALAMAPPPAAGVPRPVLPYTSHGVELLGTDLVFEIDRAVFIDLRRAHPAALANLVAFDWVDKYLAQVADDGAKLWIWVVAPWVLDSWAGCADDAVRRIASWVKPSSRGRHRLALYDGTGAEPLLPRLKALGMSPLSEKLAMKSEGESWQVPFIKILDDIAANEAARRYGPPRGG